MDRRSTCLARHKGFNQRREAGHFGVKQEKNSEGGGERGAHAINQSESLSSKL